MNDGMQRLHERPKRKSIVMAIIKAAMSGDLDVFEASAKVEKNELVIRIRVKEEE